jgi:hypothetical protein
VSWTNPPQRPGNRPPGPPPHQPPGGGQPPYPGPPPGRPGPGSSGAPPSSAARLFGGAEAWLHALVAVVASFTAMAFTAWLALWLLGAGDLGGGTMPSLVAATISLGVGGRVDLKGAENADGGGGILGGLLPDDLALAQGTGHVDVLLYGVGLVGAVILGWLFLRPLRYRLVIGFDELLAHVARIAVFTAAALGVCASMGSHALPIGDLVPNVDASELMGIFNLGAAAKFTTDVPSTLGFGLVWMLLAMVVALGVSERGPLPRVWLRYRAVLRPPVAGVMAVFFGAVVLGLLGTPFVAAAAPGPKRMIGGMLLALPNVMWLLVTLGMGVEWKSSGGGDFSFGLPGPLGKLLNESGSQGMPITVSRLAELDSRAWWVPVVSGLLLLFGGTVMALRAPATVKLYQHAWRFAVTFAVTAVIAALIAQIRLKVAVEILGGAAAPGGEVSLHADYLMTAGLGALWGACAGFLGGALAAWIRAVRGDRKAMAGPVRHIVRQGPAAGPPAGYPAGGGSYPSGPGGGRPSGGGPGSPYGSGPPPGGGTAGPGSPYGPYSPYGPGGGPPAGPYPGPPNRGTPPDGPTRGPGGPYDPGGPRR